MKEINLPYHYVYSQIIDFGIQNKVTHVADQVKLTEIGHNMVEVLRNMIEIIIILIETDNVIQHRFEVNFNTMQELVRFEHIEGHCLIDDLIKLSMFLKEKGEPFKILILKLTSLYFENTSYIKSKQNNKLLDKIGSFAIDIIASIRLTDDYYTNNSILMSLKILNSMVEHHEFSIIDKVGNKAEMPDLSETGLERISAYNTYGWLTRFITHTDTRIKVMVWNLLISLVSSQLIQHHPSLIDNAFECFLNLTEIYSVKMASLNFLTRVSEYLMDHESFINSEPNDDLEVEDQKIPEEQHSGVNLSYIIKCIDKYMVVSKIESLLYQQSVPPLFVSTLIRFLSCIRSDLTVLSSSKTNPMIDNDLSSNSKTMDLSLFTTLDIWNMLSQYLKPAFVIQKYKTDPREILFINRNKRLANTQPDENSLFDAYVIDSN